MYPTVQWKTFVVYKIAFSLYSSLLSIWYLEMGRSNKVHHRFRLFFFKRTILLLIHHQFLQFLYQCTKKSSIYHIIGNFPLNCRRNTQKTEEVYDFLQSAKLTCMDDLWTQTLCLIRGQSFDPEGGPGTFGRDKLFIFITDSAEIFISG